MHGLSNKQSLQLYNAEMKTDQSYHSRTRTKTELGTKVQSVMVGWAKLEWDMGSG